jgi:hypothetical protein
MTQIPSISQLFFLIFVSEGNASSEQCKVTDLAVTQHIVSGCVNGPFPEYTVVVERTSATAFKPTWSWRATGSTPPSPSSLRACLAWMATVSSALSMFLAAQKKTTTHQIRFISGLLGIEGILEVLPNKMNRNQKLLFETVKIGLSGLVNQTLRFCQDRR